MTTRRAFLSRTLFGSVAAIICLVGTASAQAPVMVETLVLVKEKWCVQADPVHNASLALWFGSLYPRGERVDRTEEMIERGFDFETDLFGYDSTVIRIEGRTIHPFHYGVSPLIIRLPTATASYDTVHIRVGPSDDPVLRATLEKSAGCR